MSSRREVQWTAVVGLVAWLAACAEPPNRELSQAQGALDAARAAGAAEYAPDEFKLASDTLARAHEAVTQRDYRAALAYALDGSERAQAAAKAAVEGRVKARLAAEQAVTEVSAVLAQVQARLASPEARRVPAAARRSAQRAAEAASAALSTARTAIEEGQSTATAGLDAHRQALQEALDALQPPAAPARSRSRG